MGEDMSHSVVYVLLAGRPPLAEVEDLVAKALAPFDENLEVPEYQKGCYCVGHAARMRGLEIAEERHPLEDIRRAFNGDPATAELRAHGDMFADLDELGISVGQHRAARKAVDKLWQAATAEYRKVEHEATISHLLHDKPDPKCDECKGSGTHGSTYNPRSKWDWYAIGGRWAGTIRGEADKLPDDGFDGTREAWDAKRAVRNAVRVNARLVEEFPSPVPDELIPFAVLDPAGEWHERGRMGWFGMVRDESDDWEERARALFAKHRDALAVAVDVHI